MIINRLGASEKHNTCFGTKNTFVSFPRNALPGFFNKQK
jgi:hypothetical protein